MTGEKDDSHGNGYVERMLGAVLGDFQAEIGGIHYLLPYAFDFVPEYKGVLCPWDCWIHSPAAREFYRVLGLFDRNDGIALFTKGGDCLESGGEVLPWNGQLGSQSSLVDFGRRGSGTDAAQHHTVGTEGVGTAESAAYIVCAAYIVEHYNYPAAGTGTVFFHREAAHFGGCEFAVFHLPQR